MNRLPGINEWLFSVKTFAGAMLALYIAFSIGLDRPYWALATAYIVANPLTGALRSKAMFRLLGTLVGATMTVVLVPNLANAPELLCTALALWAGLCVYLGVLDRTPRSYVFLLAGYTAALIGFPAVTTPDAIWDIALSRAEEIGLSIICTTVVATVVFPRALGPLLSNRIFGWVGNVSTWTEQVLVGDEDTDSAAGRIQLAADAVELRMLASQLAYDTSTLQSATRWVIELERRMVLLLPLLSAIEDRLKGLRAVNAVTPGLQALLADLAEWARAGPPPPRSEADRMRRSITRLEAETDPRAGWNQVMCGSLLSRLRELIDVRQDMRDLRIHIENGGGPLATPLAARTAGSELLHRDHGLALLSGLAAVVTILAICTFWIATAWQAGGLAAGLSAAACSLFAAMDDPAPILKRFVAGALLAIVFVGIGLFGILPLVHDFEILVLVLGAFYIPVGIMLAIPATQPVGAALGYVTPTLLAIQSAYAADFVSFIDGGIAAVLAIATAAVITSLMRSIGAEQGVRRLLRANWRDLAAIFSRRTPLEREALAGLLLDRLGLLVPRLAAIGAGNDLTAVGALTDLRIGVNMVELRRDETSLPPPVRAAVDALLVQTAARFAHQAHKGIVEAPSPELLRDIDRALDVTVAMPAAGTRDALMHMVGIRRVLFSNAPPYQPAPDVSLSPTQ